MFSKRRWKVKQFTTSYSGFYFPGFALLCCRVGCEGRGTPGESGMSPGRFIVFGGRSWRDLVLLEKNRKLSRELDLDARSSWLWAAFWWVVLLGTGFSLLLCCVAADCYAWTSESRWSVVDGTSPSLSVHMLEGNELKMLSLNLPEQPLQSFLGFKSLQHKLHFCVLLSCLCLCTMVTSF